jgi:hypothetical protein
MSTLELQLLFFSTQIVQWLSSPHLSAMYKDEDALPAVSHYAGIVAEPPSIRNLNR